MNHHRQLQREMKKDRLGDLPDCMIHHILSFMETKDAIQTCFLSKRWRYLWTSVPCLYFNSFKFARLAEFKKFVLWVLDHRDNSDVKVLIYLRFGVCKSTDQYLLNKVIEYAALHGVEQIIICLWPNKKSLCPSVEIPLPIFTCKSLKRLQLINCHPTNLCRKSNPFASLAKNFGFTTLTALHLNGITICYIGMERMDLFASCVNLKILQLSEMSFSSNLIPKDFVISAPKLSNLYLMCNHIRCKIIIDSPQLLSFTYLYSTPAFLEFSLPSLDGLIVDIREHLVISHRNKREDTLHGLIRMLREHHEAEVVNLSFCTIAVTCGAKALKKPECFSSTIWKSLNLKVGFKYKLYIYNLDHIMTYFHNSQHDYFGIMTI